MESQHHTEKTLTVTKKEIHINRNIIQQNQKRGAGLPVCRIDMGGKTWFGTKIDILGPIKMIYSPKN